MEKVIIRDLDIAPCEACGAYKATGQCTIMDDVEELLDKMKRHDVWVLGTPVHWAGPSAQLKCFIDHWFSKDHRPQDRAMFKGKRVIAGVAIRAMLAMTGHDRLRSEDKEKVK